MNVEREVALHKWPEHAEMCTEEDWAVISRAVEEDQPLDSKIVEPVGEAKDALLASLMILYWTMKIAHLAIRISKSVLRNSDSKNRLIDFKGLRLSIAAFYAAILPLSIPLSC